MMSCITMRRVLSSPVAKYFIFAFSILIVFCCCCLHPLEASAATFQDPLYSNNIIYQVFPTEYTSAVFFANSDFSGNYLDFPEIPAYQALTPTEYTKLQYTYENDTVSFQSLSFSFNSYLNFTSLPSGSFSVHAPFVFYGGRYGYYYYNLISFVLTNSSGQEVSFSPSSVVYLGPMIVEDYEQYVGQVNFDFVVDRSFLVDSFVSLRFVSSNNNIRYTGFKFGIPYDDSFSIRAFDTIEAQALANANAISNIGSGTPSVDFSGSQSQVNNITSHMGSFDDTYKVDTDEVDQNFTDSLNWLSDGNLTSGFGAVGGWVDRFLSDNKIWMSVITFCLCFGLALFAIGRGVSIGNSQARERNRRNRGR